MPLFISYSHADKDFVDRLATQLVAHKVNVWLDRWEMHVGESIIDRIQRAIMDASALLVILSPESVESEWCKKELNSGLIRELEERQIVVLPVLVRDCTIPMFLREKLYADFRTNFDDGLRTILEAVAKVTNEWRNRLETPTWHTDWAIDWGETDEGIAILRLTLVEVAENQPYSVLTVISLIPGPYANAWYRVMAEQRQEDVARRMVVEGLSAELKRIDFRVLLEDQFPKSTSIPFSIESGDYTANITTRLLGTDTGRDVLFDTAQQIDGIKTQMQLAAAQRLENA
ncbi:MAG: toll/interleukin-1 receptor domain-containing protein [Candidatus Tectomicrobia bacterium]|uniref:Toll/interleukin-1 receptor domain-containing protein n=1 Tax=Tectimicrobiota bacterium TaxID=2528274 RepID=A0A932GMS6_UNCTE|nr:toll/interleukin-1 receptor domain-containing protein [Candidatus Tectomicrobia bacterium]